jgi:SAM-dependent methyltransferase
MTRPEYLKAIRALSARYVERRGALPDRSPLNSAGKRAAFAGFYAPLHFLTTRAVTAALGSGSSTPAEGRDPRALQTIIDAGCGTGAAGAAWAIGCGSQPRITGIDLHGWALDELRTTWRALGLRGRAVRGDFVVALERLAAGTFSQAPLEHAGIMLGWSLNELDTRARRRAFQAIARLAGSGARILAIEPIARSLVPWWDDWAARAVASGGRADEWRFAADLPPALATLDRDAGFDRDALTARSVTFNWEERR